MARWEEEIEKLERGVDDLKSGMDQEVKGLAEARRGDAVAVEPRTSSAAVTLSLNHPLAGEHVVFEVWLRHIQD